MLKSPLPYIILFFAVLAACPAKASTVYVDASYSGSAESGTEEEPYKKIQTAVSRSIPSLDTIFVKPGTYREAGIRLRSNTVITGDDSATVVVDGGRLNTVFIIDGASNVSLKNLTIQYGSAQAGGGFYIEDSSVTIDSCIIYSNGATWGGGGIYACADTGSTSVTVKNSTISTNGANTYGAGVMAQRATILVDNSYISNNTCNGFGGGVMIDDDSTGQLDRCRITNNAAIDGAGGYWRLSQGWIRRSMIDHNTASASGGGILLDTSTVKATRNLIAANLASGSADNGALSGYGGGVYLFSSNDSALWNCIVDANACRYTGGALFCENSSPMIINNTIVNNAGNYNAQGGIICPNPSMPTVLNCILWNNGDDLNNAYAQYTQVQDGDAGTQNSSASPLFVDPNNGDYTLQDNSPCRDTGHPDAQFDDPDGTQNDRGAYGGPHTKIFGDVNDDGKVNIIDLICVRNNLNQDPTSEGDPLADTNGDGKINIIDLIYVRNRLGARTESQWP